ncbi:MAG: UDP-N-acetylmuramoyl-tripeptide--D-alanyl-D-alanine ligase [Alphaproteobacteria bacterium]
MTQQALWTSQDISRIIGASSDHQWKANSVSTDSRKTAPGDLFVALKGPQSDGHAYVLDALQKGAAAAIVDQDIPNSPADAPILKVDDSLEALRKIAYAARDRATGDVVGITGSFGKTSTKDALAFVLGEQGSVYASPRSFNNHWGVPITLSNMPAGSDYNVIEMGMNNLGEIHDHSMMVRPNVALVTNVEKMHYGKLGSYENIIKAKAEIFDGMDGDGIAVLNQDNRAYDQLARAATNAGAGSIITYGHDADCDVRIISADARVDSLEVTVSIAGDRLTYTVPSLGQHWAINSAGILGVVHALRADVKAAAEKLAKFKLPAGRGEQHILKWGQGSIKVIDDSYNAGPLSMRSALQVLGSTPAERRIAVIGDMGELGDDAIEAHESLVEDLIKYNIDTVFTSGSLMLHLFNKLPENMRGKHNDDVDALAATVCDYVKAGDTVMSKGSRGQYHHHGRMYAIVKALLDAGEPIQAVSA